LRGLTVAAAGARMYAAVVVARPVRSLKPVKTPDPAAAGVPEVEPPSSRPGADSVLGGRVPEPLPSSPDAGPTADGDSGLAQPPLLPEFRKGSVLWVPRGMIRTVRPHQWVKNLFVLAPVVFAKHLNDVALIKSALAAFVTFCLLAGAVYTINDLVDVEADRVHPVKRHRPIASGRVPIPLARAMFVGLVVVALGIAATGPLSFLAVAVGYFVLNLAYSFRLKKIAYVDVGCIALGFVLRVLAGGFATHTEVSGFMVACTWLIALFLGFGKRRHELAGKSAAKQRAALEAYTPGALTFALAVTGFGSVATYIAYTLDPHTKAFFASDWLWVTTIHPVFGVVRFLQLVGGRPKAESPTQEMLRDTPFVMNLVFYIIEVIAIVYRLRPS
jgi:decaprenyl-phosphate phosphoribosyltransferase